MLVFNGGRFSPSLNTCGVARPTAGRWPVSYQDATLLRENSLGFGSEASAPKGYQGADRAWIPSVITTGKMKIDFKAGSGFSVTAQAITKASAALVGESVLDVLCVEAHVRSTEMVGVSSISVNGKSTASVKVDLNCGATPTAQDIAQATLQMTIQGSVSLKDVMSILASFAAGKTQIEDLGGGNAHVAFRDIADTKDVIAASMSGSVRQTVVIDP